MRTMCHDCPHNKNSPTHKHLEGWLQHLKNINVRQTTPQSCHLISDDLQEATPKNVCIGHKQYLENKPKE